MKCWPSPDEKINCWRRENPSSGKNMNTEDLKLQTLLRGNRPSPTLPPRFQQNVWRRIEDAEAPVTQPSLLDSLAALILRPRFALSTTTALLLAGVLIGAVEGRQEARHEAQMNYLASVAPHSLR